MSEKKNSFNKSSTGRVVTSIDVAKLAGVSQSSVSRVLNADSGREVKDNTREKVLEAAKELGYKPNIIARSMISRRTDIIGVVIGNPVGPFYSKIMMELMTKIQEQGKQCLMFTVEAGEDINKILQRVLQYQVDGIIITAAALSPEMANICIQNETPIVLFNRFVPELNISSVYCDNIEAGRIVAEFLWVKGYTNIAYIGYEKDATSEIERKIGFYGKLREYGVYNIPAERANFTYESGYEAAIRLLKQNNSLDAIFCSSDLIAMGAMDAARFELGLKVPEDISIVGFDNVPMAAWPSYDLTTVNQPVEQLVDETIDILTELIENPEKAPIKRMIRIGLIERASTYRAK
ncbi:LacI family DNA-binding transcriptional regulator [Clostridium sp. CS001]|uniref:LacI family DNA-binding transcriptional regulator n=1 Tax=Clostridium sp. CS001 TaxID=2880648 RepID=UPI001CF3C36D|nr:LacI family DNA-binding transcriptional regulator [Clostridium sp. CS001]MCB2288615.1 LacI family DNA-binding transcriptional regulator [Clostridium sp. CS001]